MELTSRMKMARFQTFWIQMRKNKPLDKSRKNSQTSGTKITFYSNAKESVPSNFSTPLRQYRCGAYYKGCTGSNRGIRLNQF
ncbi:hypothetical protein Hanom_Chr14g01330641 [Helianthus anomalus]